MNTFCLIWEDLPSKAGNMRLKNHSILGYYIFTQSHINPSEMVAHIHIFGCLVEVVSRGEKVEMGRKQLEISGDATTECHTCQLTEGLLC